MKWHDYNFWKAVVGITLAMYVSLLIIGCGSSKTVTKQTYLKDEQNERKFDSLFTARMSYSFDKWLHYQKQENNKSTKDSSYVKDSTATRIDANGNKVGEDRFHYEFHEISQEDVQILRDSISSLKEYKDSAAIYHSKCDSLISVISKISKDKVYVEKQLSRTDRAFLNIGKIASVCLFIGILAFLGWIYWNSKPHKRS